MSKASAPTHHLYVLGHRHIGVISHLPESTTAWVRDRISGISRIYPRQGSLRSMTVFHSSSKLGKTNPKMPRQVWENRFLSSGLLNDIENKLPPKIVRNQGVDQVYQIRQPADLSEFMQPVFYKALEQKQITAGSALMTNRPWVLIVFCAETGLPFPRRFR